jgi:hypothetical protein
LYLQDSPTFLKKNNSGRKRYPLASISSRDSFEEKDYWQQLRIERRLLSPNQDADLKHHVAAVGSTGSVASSGLCSQSSQ